MKSNTPTQEDLERAAAFLRELQEISPEGRKIRITAIRALSELAREYPAARSYLEMRLEIVARKLPEECRTYRAMFLEGEAKQTARQIARRLCMDISSVNRHIRRVLRAMLPLVFGEDGVYARQGRKAAQEPTEANGDYIPEEWDTGKAVGGEIFD